MKSSLKDKPEKQIRTKEAAQRKSSVSLPKELLERQEAREQFWSTAVASLKEKEFLSFDLAVEAVIDVVLDKVGADEQANDELKEVLWCMIETDSDLEQELRSSLKIKDNS